jgi:hypothetical protein
MAGAFSADDVVTQRSPASIRPPGAVLEIVRTLRDAGFETWCVGGAVRDALLGHAHLDWDLATAATPPQVRRLFERTIPVGIEFGTVGVVDRSGMHKSPRSAGMCSTMVVMPSCSSNPLTGPCPSRFHDQRDCL